MVPKLVHDPDPDILLCTCIDGVLAIGRIILFSHTERLPDVVKTYSPVFDRLAFLRTDASSKELASLAARQHDRDTLWELAESSLSPKCWSFPQILAVAAANAVDAIEARSLGDLKFDLGIRALRQRLQEIRRETNDSGIIPELRASEDITLCGYRFSFYRGVIVKDSNGRWRASQGEGPPCAVIVRATAEQMLWLSRCPNFSPVLRTLQDRFGATELETGHFLALQAALDIGAFRDSVEDWFEAIDVFVRELERMLIEGVVVPEP
jgi:hypothetical protein